MAFMDRVMFWRKKEPDMPSFSPGGYGGQPGADAPDWGDTFSPSPVASTNPYAAFGQSANPAPFGQGPSPAFPQPPRMEGFRQEYGNPVQQQAPFTRPSFEQQDSGMQVVSAKLDAIKATLDSINQRLSNVEQVTYERRRRDTW